MNVQPLLMLDIGGTTLSAEDKTLLAHPGTGGLIFFSRNFESREQITALVSAVRAIRPDILIAVDQEGGRVQRFKQGFARIPPMRRLGERYDVDAQAALIQAHQLGALMAAELVECGIDISFAPVLDVDFGQSSVIGDRSFHSDPEKVVLLAGAFIDGMAAAGMAATGKHFPGHGFVQADSHLEQPFDTRVMADIEQVDLVPFRALAAKLQGIMPAHVVYQQVDDQPAGFSRVWLQNILRRDLGYGGLIFSDDLAMAGAASAGTYPQRARAALDAGCDMVLVCNDRPAAIEVLEALESEPHRQVVLASTLRASAHKMDLDMLAAARQLAATMTEEV
tara:strand:+ start:78165 stop:79172 length:1008 start_codon:yes stop_codon:yes gene_type:complete